MKVLLSLCLLLNISPACFSEIYQLACTVDQKDISAKLYLELNVIEFTGETPRDEFFSNYLSALQNCSVSELKTYFSSDSKFPEASKWKEYLESLGLGERIGYLKYSFDGHDVYNCLYDNGHLETRALPKDGKHARFKFLHEVHTCFSQFVAPVTVGILTGEVHPVKMDRREMSSVSYGSNNAARVYFRFRNHEDSITSDLCQLTERYSVAYKEKDLDVLSGIVTKKLLERLLLQLLSSHVDPSPPVAPIRSIGVLDMDPIYIYMATSENGWFYRKYIKQDGKYYIFNYNARSLVLENICSSSEMGKFAREKYEKAYSETN